MNALGRWMKKATPAQRERLANLAGTTVGTLRQIAGAYRKTDVTADLASRIERGTLRIQPFVPNGNHALPEVHREYLSGACRKCEFAKRCRS